MSRILLAASLSVLAGSAALAGPAADAVAFFYLPVKWEGDPAHRDRFTGPARALFDLNDRTPDGEMGCLDFSPALDAQDFDDATVAKTLVLSEEVAGDEATVTASFTLFPDHSEEANRRIEWRLVNEAGQWKIADIASPANGWRLSDFTCG